MNERGTTIVKTHRNYIDSQWTAARASRRIVNPANGEIIARVASSSAADVETAIAAAREAFDRGLWRRSTARQRGRILFQMAELVRNHAAELARMETLQSGKPIIESEADMDDAAACFEYYGGLATKVHGQTLPVPDHALNLTLKEPVGVAALIVPWNYPLLLASWKLAPALSAGCTVILKPAEQTPLTALEFARLVKKHIPDLPPGVFNIVTGDGPVAGKSLVESMHVDKVAFTGGTETGREVLHGVARSNLKKVSLELGGKSPNIFFDDCNLDEATDGALFGIFSNQGEVCSAGSRVLVQKTIYRRFLERMKQKTRQIRVGDPMRRSTRMGPLISEEHLQRVLEFIRQGRDEARLIAGGNRPARLGKGWFLQPTIFESDNTTRIAREEIFGPVVTVIPFRDEEDALRIANDTPFGLAAAVWSRDISRCLRVVKNLRAGVVWVNTIQPCHVESPWGGYKQSGLGRDLGLQGQDAFMETKQVHINLGE